MGEYLPNQDVSNIVVCAGILLSREGSEVWLYNQSGMDVFTSSATLPPNLPDEGISLRIDNPYVHKVPPGQALQVFNFTIAQHLHSTYAKWSEINGPTKLFAVMVSFRKGWGANYKRRSVFSCPCWLEIHLKPPR